MCGVCVGLLAPAYVGAALLAGLLDEEAGPRGSSPLQARPPTSMPVMSGGQF